MYVNSNVCFPGMVRLLAAAVGTFEWKRQLIVPEELLIPPSASTSIYDTCTD